CIVDIPERHRGRLEGEIDLRGAPLGGGRGWATGANGQVGGADGGPEPLAVKGQRLAGRRPRGQIARVLLGAGRQGGDAAGGAAAPPRARTARSRRARSA